MFLSVVECVYIYIHVYLFACCWYMEFVGKVTSTNSSTKTVSNVFTSDAGRPQPINVNMLNDKKGHV